MAFSFLLILISHVQSFAFRCGKWIISRGDTAYEVIAKCGEPSFVEAWEEERIARDYYDPYLFENDYEDRYGNDYRRYRESLFVKENIIIEKWTYNFGPLRFIRYLRFENGKLMQITTGDYGF